MKSLHILALGATCLIAPGSMASAGCNDTGAPCEVDSGSYHIALPDTPGTDEKLPVVIFMHGYGSIGANTMGNRQLVDPFLENGYAFIAPNGLPRGNGVGGTWIFHPDQSQRRDELSFMQDILDDAVRRFDLDRSRVLLSGFSAGAFMTTYLACRAPDAFTAYAPVSGGFWRPHPESCAGPVKLLQTHGWADGTVPLEGRIIANGRFRQGDIFHTLQIWRDTNGCDQMRADERSTKNDQWTRKWTHCDPDSALELVLWPGGHALPDGWSDMAIDWFEGVSAESRP